MLVTIPVSRAGPSEVAPPEGGQRWWELAAAAGSSLATLALLSAAADPDLTAEHAQAIESLYWPWMGALHTLLDSLIDRAEDAATGQRNLLEHYSSAQEMAERMELLAVEAARRAEAVGIEHRLILAGMTSLYLSDPNAWSPYARETTERVLGALGGLARPAMLVLRARRLAHRDGPRAPHTLTDHRGDREISDRGYPLEEYSPSGLVERVRARQDRLTMTEDDPCRPCDLPAGREAPSPDGARVLLGAGHEFRLSWSLPEIKAGRRPTAPGPYA